MVREEFKPKHYKLSALPVEPIPNAILYILDEALNKVRTYITTKTGEPIPLLDLNSGSGGGITAVTSTGNTINVTSAGTVRNIEVHPDLAALINSALQTGDNISELLNDAGYITLADVPTFDPTDYDLDDFNNASADPFARQSEISVGGAVDSVNGQTGVVVLDADDIAETATRVYITPAEKAEIATAVQPSDLGAVATSNDYGDLDNIPSTFTPSSHTHVEADITDLDKYTQAQVDTLIATKQGNFIVVSSNKTAVNDEQYSNVANATYTDPTPVEGKGYNVKVVNGTATIGGVGYAEGRIITRTFHSGSWRTKVYVDETIIGSATGTALKTKLDYWHVQVGALGSTNSTSETVLYVVDVPAGLYEIEDFFIFEANHEKDNINGNVIYRARAGVNGDTSDTLIATIIVGQNTSRSVNWDRSNCRFDTATSLRTVTPASTFTTDRGLSSGNASTSVSLNPASAWKLTITAQNVSSSDTSSLTGIKVGIIKKNP